MARNIQRGGSHARGPRRVVDWGLGPCNQNDSITSTGKHLWTQGISPSQNLTLIRTRGFVQVVLLSVGAAGDGFLGAHGICMVTEDAFAAGQASIPDPFSDSNSDIWLWHSIFDVRAITATIADGVNAYSCVSKIEVDSKAMRKNFDPEMVIVGITGVQESGTATAEINADTRMLFKT